MTRQFSLVVAGYGVEARPQLPVSVGCLIDGSLIFGPLERGAAAVKNVLLKPGRAPTGAFTRHPMGNIVTYSTGQRGSTQLVLGVDMPTYEPVLTEFHVADHPAHWSIITDDHSIQWPGMASLYAHGVVDGRGSPYQLSLGAGKLITPVGPFATLALPQREALAAPGQRLVREDSLAGATDRVTFIELAYEHENVPWLQRYYSVPMVQSYYLVQAQAPVLAGSAVFEAADLVAASMRSPLTGDAAVSATL